MGNIEEVTTSLAMANEISMNTSATSVLSEVGVVLLLSRWGDVFAFSLPFVLRNS